MYIVACHVRNLPWAQISAAKAHDEAAVELGWCKWLGDKGVFVGMKSFGASAPGKVCFEKFGFTPDNITAAAKKALANCK